MKRSVVNPKRSFKSDETYLYCSLGIFPTCHMGPDVENNFLMGVKFWTSWGVATTIFKNTLEEGVFIKIISYLTVLEGILET